MERLYQIELLKTIWHNGGICRLVTADGQAIEVRNKGEYDHEKDRFLGVEVVAGEIIYRGEIVIWVGDQPPAGDFENCVMQVAPYPCARIFKKDSTPLIQAIFTIRPELNIVYRTLRESAPGNICTKHIADMNGFERISMFTRLTADRLHRKCGEINDIFQGSEMNWSETAYVMLMRSIGGRANKEAFKELARRVRYNMLLRERDRLLYVESMLLGTSGLLEIYGDDSYVRDLKTSYTYLRNKYDITPMVAGQWNISRNNPNNHPVIRIAQLAVLFTTREFIFEKLIKCRTVEDMHDFFRVEASQYWSTHYIPSVRSAEYPKRLGHFTANVMGINLTVPMMFAYADYIGDEGLKEVAIVLLEKINCEDNSIITEWRSGGVPMESAFDSQAILQLNNEYCAKGLCWMCPVGRRIIGGVLSQNIKSE